jgi:acetyl-CoA/propionyl-CoA carboxylase carboxyl transferase subunit
VTTPGNSAGMARTSTTAEDRLSQLSDPGSLRLDPVLPGSGVRSGTALVHGVRAGLFACDPAVAGGAMGEDGCDVIVRAVRRAAHEADAVVGVWHSGGARLQDGTSSLDGVGRVFEALVSTSGVIPRISVVLGPCAGGAAYAPALTDLVVAGPASRVFVTGPDVVRAATGERVDASVLGGPEVHARSSGVVHRDEPSDRASLSTARALVSLLAGTEGADPGPVDRTPAALVPASPRQAYDMASLVDHLLDDDSAVHLRPRWAPNVVTALGRWCGTSVGVLANNPSHLAGCLDCTGSEKAAEFVDLCDRHGLPLVVLVDVPGYLPGSDQEAAGIVARGARLLTAFASCRVPRVTVIVRKAYGGAFIAMNSRSLGADAVFAWPTAEVGVMYPDGAVRILHRRLLEQCPPEGRDRLAGRLAQEYRDGAGGLARALACGHVDEVIEPGETRRRVHRVISDALDRARISVSVPVRPRRPQDLPVARRA